MYRTVRADTSPACGWARLGSQLLYSVSMKSRDLGFADRVIGEIDKLIKVLTVPARSARPLPEAPIAENLTPQERQESARLMRVNHSGEVAAQALYQGQALTARQPAVKLAMNQAAAEGKRPFGLVWPATGGVTRSTERAQPAVVPGLVCHGRRRRCARRSHQPWLHRGD